MRQTYHSHKEYRQWPWRCQGSKSQLNSPYTLKHRNERCFQRRTLCTSLILWWGHTYPHYTLHMLTFPRSWRTCRRHTYRTMQHPHQKRYLDHTESI
mgnify:CR=1 FL=1